MTNDIKRFDDHDPSEPETDYQYNGSESIIEEAKNNIKDFSLLLDEIESIDDKVKALWKQIYENAITDRRNAYLAWSDLYFSVHGKEDKHAIHGQTLAKYMERMEKANAQLLKLAELVQNAIDADIKNISAPEMPNIFEQLHRKKGVK